MAAQKAGAFTCNLKNVLRTGCTGGDRPFYSGIGPLIQLYFRAQPNLQLGQAQEACIVQYEKLLV